MQEGENKFDRKRVVITSVTTFSLLVLPYSSIPENIFFIVPGAVEVIAVLVLLGWTGYQASSVSKKKVNASENLRRSIDDEIERLRGEIDNAHTPAIAKLLDKQLIELYKVRADQSAVQRKNLWMISRSMTTKTVFWKLKES